MVWQIYPQNNVWFVVNAYVSNLIQLEIKLACYSTYITELPLPSKHKTYCIRLNISKILNFDKTANIHTLPIIFLHRYMCVCMHVIFANT